MSSVPPLELALSQHAEKRKASPFLPRLPMQWIQMVLTSFQRHSALSLHAKCKHTLICMSPDSNTVSATVYNQ